MKEKRRHYLNKDSDHLRRMAQELARDESWCKSQAESLGNTGAAAEHYLRCAQGNRRELERIHEELRFRGELQ
jgi:hypothetical protein